MGGVMDNFMQAAIDEAKAGRAEGGIPIGAVLVHDGTDSWPGAQPSGADGISDPARRDRRT